jgi:DNA-directed RNA polymerase specialized sigma24 family protein
LINPEDYTADINAISRRVAREFGNRFDWEDIAQATALDMLERPKRYDGIGGNLLLEIIRRTGVRWCAQECSKFLKFGDQTIYSSEELKRLLPKFYDPASWPNGLSQPSFENYKDVASYAEDLEEWASNTSLSVEMLDIEYGINMLTTAQREVIEKKYRDRAALVSKYDRNIHSKAIRYLTYHLNHRVEKSAMNKPTRTAVSNRQAIQMTEYQETANGGFNDDGLTKLQTTNAYNHPLTRKSQYVVNSPWRKA